VFTLQYYNATVNSNNLIIVVSVPISGISSRSHLWYLLEAREFRVHGGQLTNMKIINVYVKIDKV